MRRFAFRLDPVLGHREALLRERQRELSEAQLRVNRLERALVSLDLRRRECQEQVRASALGEMDRTEMFRLRSYANTLWLQLLSGAQELAGQRARAEEARSAMVAARQGVRALEIVREKAVREWSREVAREERRFLDDLRPGAGLLESPVRLGGPAR